MDEQELRGWSELDPVKRAAHFIRMNDIVVPANVVIPPVPHNRVAAGSSQIRGIELSGWDSTLWASPTGTGRRDARHAGARSRTGGMISRRPRRAP
jgi:hypothetical protein